MKIPLILLLLFTLSSCFQSSKFDTCDRENEKLVRVDGGEKCLPTCSNDNQCKNEDVCVSSVCAPEGSILSITSPKKSDVAIDVRVNDTSEDVILISDEEADKACADFTQKAVDCARDECIGSGIDLLKIATLATDAAGGETCQSSFKENPAFRESIDIVLNSLECTDTFWKGIYCSVSLENICQICEASIRVGEACAEESDCRSGDFGSACFKGETDSEFRDGYCSAGCSDPNPDSMDTYFYENEEQCGPANSCVVFVSESRNGVCLKGCSKHSDCRTGYVCDVISLNAGTLERICFTESEPCDPAKCTGRCGVEEGPAGGISTCQFECTVQGTTICESANGTCSAPDEMDRSFCVLP